MDKKLTSEQKWEQAGLENGFIFYKVFRTHPEACKKLIEILLHIEIEKIEMAEEETIFIDREAKGIRLDLYVKNDTHVFDVELQVRNTKELAERARYYQGIMDVDSIKPKQHYHELKNSHVIFICIDDIFEQGLPIYTFENLCLEDKNIKLNDRTYKHFFIAKNCVKMLEDKEQKAFFNLLLNKNATNEYTKDLKTYIEVAKKNTQWRHTFMDWDRDYLYDLEESEQRGIQQNKLQTARIALENDIPLEMIVKLTGLSIEEITALEPQTTNSL